MVRELLSSARGPCAGKVGSSGRGGGARVAVGLAVSGLLSAAAAVGACIAALPPNGQAAAAVSAESSCNDGFIDLAMGEQCDPGPAAGDAGLAGCTVDCKMQCPEGFVWPENNHCYTPSPGTAATLDMDAITRCAAGTS
jgi:hypothetical protein